jgi:hypothetical protein
LVPLEHGKAWQLLAKGSISVPGSKECLPCHLGVLGKIKTGDLIDFNASTSLFSSQY